MTAKVALHPLYKVKRQVESAVAQFNEASTWQHCPESDYLYAKYRDFEAIFKWSPALYSEDVRFIMEWTKQEWLYATKNFTLDEISIAAALETYSQDAARKDAAEKGLPKE